MITGLEVNKELCVYLRASSAIPVVDQGQKMVCNSFTYYQGERLLLLKEAANKCHQPGAQPGKAHFNSPLHRGCDSWVTAATINNLGYIEFWSKGGLHIKACTERREEQAESEGWFKRRESKGMKTVDAGKEVVEKGNVQKCVCRGGSRD